MRTFNLTHIANHLSKFSQTITYIPRKRCPCVVAGSHDADPACPFCAGTKYYNLSPVSAQVVVTGQDIQKAWESYGNYETGDCVVSIDRSSPAYNISPDDRVIFENVHEPFSTTTTKRSQSNTEILPSFFARADIDSVSYITNTQIASLSFKYFSNDLTLQFYSSVPAGTQLSISGTKRPLYTAFQVYPRDRSAHCNSIGLPKRIVLRRETER